MNEFHRTDADEHERLEKLKEILAWAANARRAHPNAKVVLFGSIVRGDYWRGQSDVDVMIFAPTQAEADAAHAAIQGAVPGVHWAVTDAMLAVHLAVLPAARSLADPPGTPINFGLHGFDTLGHHLTLLADSPFVTFDVPQGADLVRLGCERLRFLTTAGQPGNLHPPNEKAIEAIKASTITMCARMGHAPTRHKGLVPVLFERLVPPFAQKELWRWAWNDYRSGQRTLTDAALNAFVDGVVTAVVP